MVDEITTSDSGISRPQAPVGRVRNTRVIVFGNEKGGTGKSTTAMHVIIALLREGLRVGAIDLDARQGTLTRYFDNRRVYAARQGLRLPQPLYRTVGRSELRDRYAADEEEKERLVRALAALSDCDIIVLDTPGSDNHLSREGHSYADILISPLNDSFVDLDLLGRIDIDTHKMLAPSKYSEMVWEQKKRRMLRGDGAIDWIVMRNRLASLESRNKRNMDRALADLSRRLGLRLVAGFSERVIFRELFLKGLTLLDLRDEGTDVTLTMSHVAALQEIRNLLRAIGVERQETEGAASSTSLRELQAPTGAMS
ncbi:MAG: AAA family ATPase [Alphaproteobacteria bacterium]|nr:AAA family ATPase [Alphaproteobacteria bacterium]